MLAHGRLWPASSDRQRVASWGSRLHLVLFVIAVPLLHCVSVSVFLPRVVWVVAGPLVYPFRVVGPGEHLKLRLPSIIRPFLCASLLRVLTFELNPEFPSEMPP